MFLSVVESLGILGVFLYIFSLFLLLLINIVKKVIVIWGKLVIWCIFKFIVVSDLFIVIIL